MTQISLVSQVKPTCPHCDPNQPRITGKLDSSSLDPTQPRITCKPWSTHLIDGLLMNFCYCRLPGTRPLRMRRRLVSWPTSMTSRTISSCSTKRCRPRSGVRALSSSYPGRAKQEHAASSKDRATRISKT